jgi:hypothetical protein
MRARGWLTLALLGLAACAAFGSSDGPTGNPTPPQGGDGTSSSSTSSSSSGSPASLDGGTDAAPGDDDIDAGACVFTETAGDLLVTSCLVVSGLSFSGTSVTESSAKAISVTSHGSAFCGSINDQSFIVSIIDCMTVFVQSDDSAVQAVVSINGVDANVGANASSSFTISSGHIATIVVHSPNVSPWKLLIR